MNNNKINYNWQDQNIKAWRKSQPRKNKNIKLKRVVYLLQIINNNPAIHANNNYNKKTKIFNKIQIKHSWNNIRLTSKGSIMKYKVNSSNSLSKIKINNKIL